jgi:hypothetical protein
MGKMEDYLKEFKKAAKRDQDLRKDPRYLRTMAFLTTKGFLFANTKFPYIPNVRLQVDDAIWAGRNLEPRILEVLPAAVLRLPKHFDFDPIRHHELACTLKDLREKRKDGRKFEGVPFKKLKVWIDFELKDGRIKTQKEKRLLKTFRLKPETIEKLEKLGLQTSKNITAVIEDLVQNI